MASVVGKRVNGATYYYLVRSTRVNGKPRVTEQRYLGAAEDIAAAMRGSHGAPESSEQLSFGDLAAVWSVLTELDFPGTVDAVAADKGLPLALAVLHRACAPETPFAEWWNQSAAKRFVRPKPSTEALAEAEFTGRGLSEHRLTAIQHAIASRVLERLGDTPTETLVLELPNFAATVLTTMHGAIPLLTEWDTPGAWAEESFTASAERLSERAPVSQPPTLVFDNEQQPADETPFLSTLPIAEYPTLRALAANRRSAVDPERFAGLTAVRTRMPVNGVDRPVVLTHSERLHRAQSSAFHKSLRAATRRLAAIEAGPRERQRAELARMPRDRWLDRVLSVNTGGEQLDWHVDELARARLEEDYFGKQLLVTSREDWSLAEVVTAQRARYHLDGTLRMLDRTPSDERGSRVHALIGMLATTVVHLLRHRAAEAGIDRSARELLETLAGIGETVLRYPSTGGRRRTERLLTETDQVRRRLYESFGLDAYAPG